MRVKIYPSRAAGQITPPSSKSVGHRLLIAAALAEGKSTVRGVTPSADIIATVRCLRALGVKIENFGKDYTVYGRDIRELLPSMPLDAGESGSTLRFLIPLAMQTGKEVTLLGGERLMQRPLSVYEKIAEDCGAKFELSGNSLSVMGELPSGEYTVFGGISSQFITGLIFALSVLPEDSVINITPPFESRSYIDLTLAALRTFGVMAYFEDELTIKIPGGQKYKATDASVEGDYSAAAFLDALSLIGGEVEVLSLNADSAQGDRAYRELYPKLKAGFCEIDISDCPDLGPILFALAAYFGGCRFTGTDRLRIKESDRALAMKEELSKLGARVIIGDNTVTVEKSTLHAPTEPICAHNDHRIVMAMATLLTVLGGEIIGAEAVAKSYPDYFSDIEKLGIRIEKYDEAN